MGVAPFNKLEDYNGSKTTVDMAVTTLRMEDPTLDPLRARGFQKHFVSYVLYISTSRTPFCDFKSNSTLCAF